MIESAVIVPHQGYVTLDVRADDNRVMIEQESDDAPAVITIVGRQNLDLIIDALTEAREALW